MCFLWGSRFPWNSRAGKAVKIAPLVLISAIAGVCQSVITMTPGTVLSASPERVGINMGTPAAYHSGQIYKNMVLPNNVGAEPIQLIQVQNIQTGAGSLSTTTFQSNLNNLNYDAVPAGWWVGGNMFVAQSCGANSQACTGGGAELHCSSTITANTVAGSAPNGTVYTFSPACAASVAVGDTVFLTQKVSNLNGIGTTGTVTISNDTCGTQCGVNSFKLSGNSSSSSVFWNFDYAGGNPDNFRLFCNFYNVTTPCAAPSAFMTKFIAKVTSGTPTVTVTAYRGATPVCSTSVPISGSRWTQYSASLSCTDSIGTSAPGAQLDWVVSGTGAWTALFDNFDFELNPSTTDPTNTSIYSDAYIATLRILLNKGASGNNGTLRYNINPSGLNLDDWIQPTYAIPNIAQGIHLGAYTGSGQRTDALQDYLLTCHLVGADPYIILPINLLETDAPHLVDFLYGSSGTTYGAKRIALGGPSGAGGYASWFRTIHMSLGNENWNSGFLGYNLGYRSGTTDGLQDYMSRGNTIFTDMRGTASYIASQTDLILGGQQFTPEGSPSSDFANFGHPDSIEIAGYTQLGAINDVSTNALLFGPMLAEPYIMVSVTGNDNPVKNWMTNTAATTGCGPAHNVACHLDIYEQGPSPFTTTMTQTQMNGFDSGAAYGVSQANQFMLQGENVGWTQNHYSLAQYSNSLASLNQGIWGTCVDMGGSSSLTNAANIPFGSWCNPRPILIGLYLDNQAIIGPEVWCAWSGATANALYDLGTNNNAVTPTNNVPYLYVSCFQSATNPSNYSMVIRNTDQVNSYPISWGTGSGTVAPGTGVTVKQMAAPSANPFAANEAAIDTWTGQTAASVTMTSNTQNLTSGFTVPPLSVTTLLFSTSAGTTNSVALSGQPVISESVVIY